MKGANQVAGWMKGPDMSSVHMLSSGCLCLCGLNLWILHECLQLCVHRGQQGGKANAVCPWLFWCIALSSRKAQFGHGTTCCWKLKKPKHEWDQKELQKSM